MQVFGYSAKRKRQGIKLITLLVAVFLVINSAGAIETLYSFKLGPRSPQAGLVGDTNGNLYGTTYAGGTGGYGAVYLTTVNGGFANFNSFGYTNGANPTTAVVWGRANPQVMYGTTVQGGSNDLGAIFSTTTNGLPNAVFSFGLTNGANPGGALICDGNDNLYGTTYIGGTNVAARFYGFGTIFSISGHGVPNWITTFNYTNGANPQGSLVLSRNGNLYGTTAYGGVSSNGTVFKVTTTGSLTSLFSFDFANGAAPCGGLVEYAGYLYGTTSSGGSTSNGTSFKISTNGIITSLFSFIGFNGSNPQAGLTLASNGYFYGTTFGGGVNSQGTVFQLNPNGSLTTLVSFNGENGANPAGVLYQAADGNLYGTTPSGGVSGAGTVFRISPAGDFGTIVSLDPGGGYPCTGLFSTNGGFYGGLGYGGPSSNGMVFRFIQPAVGQSAMLNVLIPFGGTNSAIPSGEFTSDTNGNVYGTIYGGGASNNGAIFELTPNGAFSNTFSFTPSSGAHPIGGLLLDNTGANLCGTTSQGGPTGSGTVYKFALGPTNTFATLAPFVYDAFSEGAFPEGVLAQDSNNNYYGTTSEGGASGYGCIFMLTNGILTNVHSFSYSDGINPETGLIHDGYGNFYGTTPSGGTNGAGTVFKFAPYGGFSVLASFSGSDGANPQGPLTQGPDGQFYGITEFGGGTNGYGTVFRVNPAGGSTCLAVFNGTDGAYPNGGLALGPDGDFYGTTSQGGINGVGTVFRLWPELSYSRQTNQLLIAWSTNLSGAVLQSASSLDAGAAWNSVSGATNLGSEYIIRVPDTDGNQFYRLGNVNH